MRNTLVHRPLDHRLSHLLGGFEVHLLLFQNHTFHLVVGGLRHVIFEGSQRKDVLSEHLGDLLSHRCGLNLLIVTLAAVAH